MDTSIPEKPPILYRSGRVADSFGMCFRFLEYLGYEIKPCLTHPGRYLVQLRISKIPFGASMDKKQIKALARASREFAQIQTRGRLAKPRPSRNALAAPQAVKGRQRQDEAQKTNKAPRKPS